MTSGAWTPTIRTTDQYGGQTVSSPSISFINPLPVTLVSFTAQPQGEIVRLNWSTSTEINNDYFEVERSGDGTQFNSIGMVAGHNTSYVINDYISYDENPLDGINYYRLKQVDNNGTYTYSKIVAIKMADRLVTNVKVFPNPLTNGQDIHITASLDANSLISVKLFNATAEQVYDNSLTENKGQMNLVLPADNLKPGLYTLILVHNDQQFIQKIIVQ
jgi:hypothetical protein